MRTTWHCVVAALGPTLPTLETPCYVSSRDLLVLTAAESVRLRMSALVLNHCLSGKKTAAHQSREDEVE